jgi:hypothetical protein
MRRLNGRYKDSIYITDDQLGLVTCAEIHQECTVALIVYQVVAKLSKLELDGC